MNSEPYILPFASAAATLESVGGKGASLARLSRAGHPVPGGFLVTTAAYRAFTAANALDERLFAILQEHALDDMAGLDAASDAIRALFEAGSIPPELAQELCAAYQAAGSGPVAVRSSATAEDLPDLSFAGQQETFLNVLGQPALLRAVVSCWASLWTGRAIGYRARQGIAPHGLALAVVVQQMVPSQASGVLFTANPLSGLRSEVVIDATLGLGEALVSGQVEPDHYVVDMHTGAITAKTLGAKALSIRPRAGGGTDTQAEGEAARVQALPDEQILALARLGKQVEAEAGFPQDIEWGWADGRMNLLQSRPITSLFPLPDNGPLDPQTGVSREALKVYFSFGAVQGMLDPLTPLGGDLIMAVFALGTNLFGYQHTLEDNSVLFWGGERLWANMATLMRNSVGRRVARAALGFVEPSIRQALMLVWDDPALQPQKQGISLGAIRRMSHFFPGVVWNVLVNMAAPEKRREVIVGTAEKILAETRAALENSRGSPREKLAQGIAATGIYSRALPRAFPLFIAGVAAGMAPFNALNNFAKSLPRDPAAPAPVGWCDLALEVTRGMPYNPTTEMDLALWQTAQAIRADQAAQALFRAAEPAELARLYQGGGLPPAAQTAIGHFMERYGARGLAEIDAGRARWREDPTHVMQVLGSYLQIENEAMAPSAVFERGAQSAARAVETLARGLRSQPGGWFKAHAARAAARRARALLGLREHPKFFAVRLIGAIRQALLECGAELVQAGELEQADDLFFLRARELQAFAAGDAGAAGAGTDWKALVAGRRAAYARELKRRQIPRLLLSDGRAFYEGMAGGETGKSLMGSPVSPGAVEGAVRVILDPRGAQILPGEILVCPGTDPSWTPLFLAAGGLVMEVGGMMTHGAVVAREYGIPAVVGVHQATTRLVTGQRIRVDGSSGVVTLLG